MRALNRNLSVLIPDGDSYTLRIVLNCLSENKNWKIHVIASELPKTIACSNKITEIHALPNLNKENEIDWIYGINNVVETHNIDIILPIDEKAIRCLSKNKWHVTPNKLGLVPPIESFNKAINKGELSKYLTYNQLPSPTTFLFSEHEICEKSPINFPVIMKLIEDYIGGGAGIILFNDEKSLNHYFLNNKIEFPYLIQDYIEGYDIDCSVLCENGEILAFTIQKATMKDISDFMPPLGVEFLYNKEVYAIIEELMISLNWSGVAHVDMRYDANDNSYKIIEINPRFWLSLDASLMAGVNFTHFYCLASKGVEFEVPKYKNIRYLNLVGLNKAIKKNLFFIFKFKFLVNNTPLKFYKKDLLPMAYMVFYKLKSIVKKALRF
ncbi:ATP-grasp domain-containing protein [Mariniflexile fucanivorans]|uniref:ATP-grasp domain-containing protein n=1 Tax=Mariniflexile fucanivorans TaxID=264023 RepID=A0A4R1RFV2_9FLAO|nr:ATP-grasp domain-containing protein [Mariniflexile fucanivorans]TCL64854.1 ATP-grasp domain-containing protein [Mariniflexile fucanivorans]